MMQNRVDSACVQAKIREKDEEVVADFAGNNIFNEDFARDVVSGLYKVDKTKVQQIIDRIRKLFNELISFARETKDNKLAENLANARDMWVAMFQESAVEEEKTSNKEKITRENLQEHIAITISSNGYQKVTRDSKSRWDYYVSDLRSKYQNREQHNYRGWGEQNGLTYFIVFDKGGRGHDNTTLWFKETPSQAAKDKIEELVNEKGYIPADNAGLDKIIDILNKERGEEAKRLYEEATAGKEEGAGAGESDENVKFSVVIKPDDKREVAIVKAEKEHGFKNFKEATQWAKENIVGEYENPEIGSVNISNQSIGKYLSKKAVGKSLNIDVHLSTLKVIPSVIENSVVGEIHEDKKGDVNIRDIVRLYGCVDIDGTLYRVKSTVKRYVNDNEKTKAYSYEVTKIELLEGERGDVINELPHSSSNSIPVANLVNNPQNDKGNEIKFSVSAPVEKKGNLVAIHNLNADKLNKSLDLGGMPMPSIAITKVDMEHKRFGDISLVFDESTIDPRYNSGNIVWSGDAWTPSFPKIEKKLSKEVVNRLYDKINNLVPKDKRIDDLYLEEGNIENTLSSTDWDVIKAYAVNGVMKQAYLAEQGKSFKVPMKEKSYGFNNELLRKIVDVIREAEKEGIDIGESVVFFNDDNNPKYKEAVDKIQELKLQYDIEKALSKMSDLSEEDKKKFEEDARKYHKPLNFQNYDRLVNTAERMNRDLRGNNDKIPQVPDMQAAKESIDKKVPSDNKKYNEWLRTQFEGIVEQEGIRNDKDLYTPSGNRRSFEQLHDDVNIGNILAYMLKQNERGGKGFFGSDIFGASSKKYQSMSEIRADADRLKNVDKDEYVKMKGDITNKLGKIVEESVGKEGIGAMLDMRQDIIEALSQTHDVNGLYNKLHRLYSKFTKDHAKRLVDIVKEIQQLPEEYFEAKPRRIVGFNEVKVAVVPEGIKKELKDKMKAAGIKNIQTYDPFVDNRAEVLNKATEKEDIRFSVVRTGDDVISLRGFEAKQQGKYPEKEFIKNYDLNKKKFDLFRRLGLIESDGEWHHVGKNFDRKEFYHWSDFAVDYMNPHTKSIHTEQSYTAIRSGNTYNDNFIEEYNSNSNYEYGVPQENTIGRLYKDHKKEIDQLVKEYDRRSWEWKSEEVFFDNNRPMFDSVDKYLTEEEKTQREAEHKRITDAGESLGTGRDRFLMHDNIDKKYNAISLERYKKIEEEYKKDIQKDIDAVEQKNKEIRKANLKSEGKENALMSIMQIFGETGEDSLSKVMRAKSYIQQEQRNKYAKEFDKIFNERKQEKIAELENKRDKYLKDAISKGNAQRVERVAEKPDLFVTTAEEMNGRYGWFEANSRYKYPVYYSGYAFNNTRSYNHYNNLVEQINLTKREGYKQEDLEDYIANQEKGVRYSVVGVRGATALDRAEESNVRIDNLTIAREDQLFILDSIEKAEQARKGDGAELDNQGNPIDNEGKLILEKVNSIDEITDEDFTNPYRNIQLPNLPKGVNDAIGANGKPIVIKKNIFEKNNKKHKDITPTESRKILNNVLYNPDLYGQNQKMNRPYNWILIHLADKNESVIVEVNENKENVEIVNWHYIGDVELDRKKRQAIREGGHILTLESAAANTQNSLSLDGKDTTNSQTEKKNEENFSLAEEFNKEYEEAGKAEAEEEKNVRFSLAEAIDNLEKANAKQEKTYNSKPLIEDSEVRFSLSKNTKQTIDAWLKKDMLMSSDLV